MGEKIMSESEVRKLLLETLEQQGMLNGDLTISGGSEKGDGYLSFMTRVDVVDGNKKFNVVIKCAPKGELVRQMAPLRACYLREINYYDVVFPSFKNFETERGVSTPFSSYPKCYKTVSDDDNELLVLENIKERGFSMWNRKVPMDDEHITLAFKEYGKFHAISFAMKEQNRELFDTLTSDLGNVFKQEDMKPEVFKLFLDRADRIADMFNGDDQRVIHDDVANFSKNIGNTFAFYNDHPGDFVVITHGDCWCNNMMFRYESSTSTTPVEICLLDFQIGRIATPVFDLSYFFHVSAAKEHLDQHKHYLKIYHDSLSEHLKLLGSDAEKVFPFTALMEEWRTYSKYGFLMSMFVFKAMLKENSELIDLMDVKDSGRSLFDMFSDDMINEEIIDGRLKDLAIYMHENGYLANVH